MYWLITYQQNTGHQYKMANKVTDMHPADWLLKTDSGCPGADTVVVFAIEINKEQYSRMKDEI
jgi:hypothetical protein